MSRFRVFVICVFFSFSRVDLCTAAPSLHILTLNTGLVCVGPACILAESPNGKERAKIIGQWIRAQNPDVVLLQEIWQEFQFALIKDQSAMPYGYYAGKPAETAILSRFPLSNGRFTPFVWTGGTQTLHAKIIAAGYRAGMTTASIQLEDSRTLILGNVHAIPRDLSIAGFEMPADTATPERLIGLMDISHQLQTHGESLPIVLGGDFNMNQKSTEYQVHTRRGVWTDSYRQNADPKHWMSDCTFCSENPFVKSQAQPGEGILDYLFARAGCTRVKDAQILKTADTFSDHRVVSTSIEIIQQPCQGDLSNPLTMEEMAQVRAHIESADLKFLSLLGGPDIWFQRRRALEFLQTATTVP